MKTEPGSSLVEARPDHRIFTCWATIKEDLSAPWMIWACDEYAYEANPEEVEAVLKAMKKELGSGFEFREVTVMVSYGAVTERFLEGQIEGALADA